MLQRSWRELRHRKLHASPLRLHVWPLNFAEQGIERARLLRFAENLGLVFQIRDDMLDSIGDAAVVGKAVRKDAEAGRKSATALLGLDGAAQQASDEWLLARLKALRAPKR